MKKPFLNDYKTNTLLKMSAHISKSLLEGMGIAKMLNSCKKRAG